MSEFLDIINKLAEKSILNGNDDFAIRLVQASDLLDKCKYCREADALSGKEACGKCSKKTSCSLSGCDKKTPYGEMVKYADKVFCCSDCVKKFKESMKPKTALNETIEKYVSAASREQFKSYEESWNRHKSILRSPGCLGKVRSDTYKFDTVDNALEASKRHPLPDHLNWEMLKKEDGTVILSIGRKMNKDEYIKTSGFLDDESVRFKGKDAITNNYGNDKVIIETLNGEFIAYLDDSQELGTARGDSPGKAYNNLMNMIVEKGTPAKYIGDDSDRGSFASNNLKQMIKKYAQGYIGDDQMFSMDEDDAYPFNSAAEGFDASMSDGDNPYSPGSLEYKAWQMGYEEGLKSQNQPIPDFKGDF